MIQKNKWLKINTYARKNFVLADTITRFFIFRPRSRVRRVFVEPADPVSVNSSSRFDRDDRISVDLTVGRPKSIGKFSSEKCFHTRYIDQN